MKFFILVLLISLLSMQQAFAAKSCAEILSSSRIKQVAIEQEVVVQINQLLVDPLFSGHFELGKPQAQRLMGLVASQIPTNPYARAEAFRRLFSQLKDPFGPLVNNIPFETDAAVFTSILLQTLGVRGLLPQQNTAGNFVLVEYLKEAKNLEKSDQAFKPTLSVEKENELAKLLTNDAAKSFPLLFSNLEIQRINEILAEIVPLTWKERLEPLEKIYGRDLALSFPLTLTSNYHFANTLLQLLSAKGKLATHEGERNPLLTLYN